MKKKLEEMNKLQEEEEDSPLVSVIPNLACKESPSKPGMQPTHGNTEMNSNESIYKVMM